MSCLIVGRTEAETVFGVRRTQASGCDELRDASVGIPFEPVSDTQMVMGGRKLRIERDSLFQCGMASTADSGSEQEADLVLNSG